MSESKKKQKKVWTPKTHTPKAGKHSGNVKQKVERKVVPAPVMPATRQDLAEHMKINNMPEKWLPTDDRRAIEAMFLSSEKGQGMVEYALGLLIVAIVVIAILSAFGPTIKQLFEQAFAMVSATRAPNPTVDHIIQMGHDISAGLQSIK